MNLLVTGGAGYIGSHTVLALAEGGHEVTILDNFVNASRRVPERLATLTSTPLRIIECDIRDADSLNQAFAETRPGAIVHFAGLKSVTESQDIPLDYYEINVQGTVALLKAMEQHGCDRIVFSSSAVVYGTAQYLPIDENHPSAPENPYGHTKAFSERIIKDWVASRPGSGAVLLRYFNPVGAHESGEIGESPTTVPANLMPVIIEVAAGQRRQLAIFGSDWDTPDGTGLRDFIHVMDLAEAHAAALNFVSAHKGAHVFNIGTGQGVTVLQLVDAFQKATGHAIPYTLTSRRPNDIGSSVADPSRAQRALGWSARRDVVEMCRSAWRWRTRNPQG